MSKERLCTTDLAKEAGLPVHRFPITHEEAAIAEHALARALDKLSLDEQEKIIFDVHGIAITPSENEENISSALHTLEKEIAKISKKDAYNQAVFLNEQYVRNPKFQIMFLRALEFNAEAAADMIVNHFEVKRELFGDGDILARDVHQSDLTPRDMEIVERGICQILPTRDASGRAVMCITSDFGDARMTEFGRPTFYVCMAMLREKEIQETGAVWVAYNMNNNCIDLLEYADCNRVEAVIPLRCAGGHFCMGSHALRPLVAGFQLFINAYDRFRMRSHFGSLDSVHFNLQTFGIPTQDSPMKPDGSWSNEYHLEWLQVQRLQEEEDSAKDQQASVVVIPRKYDVLFGKSARARLSTGTQRALHLVDMHREEYEKASKYAKTDLAEKIMATIHESNGRFLKQDDKKGGWIVVDDVVARQKIAHWFRHMRWKSSRSQEGENSEESQEGSSRSVKSRDNLNEESYTDYIRPTKRVTPSTSPLPTEADSTISMSASSSSTGVVSRIMSGIVDAMTPPVLRSATPEKPVGV